MTPNPDPQLDALLAIPDLEGPLASPDGRWVAWTWYRAGSTSDVFAAPSDGSAAPTRLTDGGSATLVSWAPGGDSVVVRQDHEGDERYQLLRVPVARPGAPEPLTEPSPAFFLSGGSLGLGGELFFGASRDPESGAPSDADAVYRLELRTGELAALARLARAGAVDPRPSPDGRALLYARSDRHPSGSQLWLVGADGAGDRELYSAGDSAAAHGEWLPDGRIALLAEAGGHRRVGVCGVDGDVRWLVDDPARNVERIIVPGGARPSELVVVERRATRPAATLLDVDSGEELAFPDVGGNLVPLGAAGGGWWVGERCRSDRPTEVVRFRLDGGAEPEVIAGWPAGAGLCPAEDFRWRSTDGLEVQGWLYRAPAARGALVYVHGGPTWLFEDRYSAEVQYYVSRGLSVLAPNYRGSTGFSLAYEESIKEDGWGGREQDDIRTGIEALIAAGVAEPGRVGVTGTSYGGYSSWCQITRCPPELVAAAAPICGMTDLVVDYETTRPDLRTYSAAMVGGTPEEVPERYRERSPVHFLGQVRGRLLIVQGLRDPNVSPENVRVATAELQRVGAEYQLLAFEDEGHGIARPANQRRLYRGLADFFLDSFGG